MNFEAARRVIKSYRTPILAIVIFLIVSITLTESTCVLRTITGIPCPGCGLTRATLSILRLNFSVAFRYNPMVFVIWPVAFFLLYKYLRSREYRKSFTKKYTPLFVTIGVCMILVYIVRMIYLFPDNEPLTYDYTSVFGRIFSFMKSLFLRDWS